MGTATFNLNQQSVIEQHGSLDQSSSLQGFQTPTDQVDGIGEYASDSVPRSHSIGFGVTLGWANRDITGDDPNREAGNAEVHQPTTRTTETTVVPPPPTANENEEGIRDDAVVVELEIADGTWIPLHSSAYHTTLNNYAYN